MAWKGQSLFLNLSAENGVAVVNAYGLIIGDNEGHVVDSTTDRVDDIWELKKLRRQLQGKRLIKTELCVKLSLLRLFHVDHVVQNRRSALSLACHEWFSCKGKEGKKGA